MKLVLSFSGASSGKYATGLIVGEKAQDRFIVPGGKRPICIVVVKNNHQDPERVNNARSFRNGLVSGGRYEDC